MFFHYLATEFVMRDRRMILKSKWQVNLVHESLKVFQLLPLDFVAVRSIKYLAPFLVSKLTCLMLVLRDMRAVLSVERSSVALPVYKELKVVKLTSFSDVHQAPFFGSRSERSERILSPLSRTGND